MMVSTTTGGRPLKSAASRPGATHGGSIDLDAGAIWCRAPERGGQKAVRESIAVISRSDSGIATAGAAVKPNLPLQKLQLTLWCSDRHPVVGRSAKDTAGTLHAEGPARSIGSSTGCRAQSARGAMVPWGFATTVILRSPVLPTEVDLTCLQPGRELDRDGGNRAPPLCWGNGAWPQLRDEHPQWEDDSSTNATSACLLPRHVRQRLWPSPSARQRPHPERHGWYVIWRKVQLVFTKMQRQVCQMQHRL